MGLGVFVIKGQSAEQLLLGRCLLVLSQQRQAKITVQLGELLARGAPVLLGLRKLLGGSLIGWQSRRGLAAMPGLAAPLLAERLACVGMVAVVLVQQDLVGLSTVTHRLA